MCATPPLLLLAREAVMAASRRGLLAERLASMSRNAQEAWKAVQPVGTSNL